ncbi:PTS system mannose/fructose/sorbose family transporter subunit IID [Rickettsiales bacterium LUAb2]
MEYQDKTVNKVVTKRDLNIIAFFRSTLLQASFNYERMQAGGWLYGILPVLKKIHTNKEDLKKSLKLHLELFNINPFLTTFTAGIVLAMEEAKESIELIRNIKIATMGPLGGIGDALIWLTLLPITAGVGASMSLEGSYAGPFIFIIVFNLVVFGLRYGLMHYGYITGLKAIANLKNNTRIISHVASIMALTVIGGLVASYVHLDTLLVIKAGAAKVNLQADVFDKIMPNLLPLTYVFIMYYCLKRGFHPLYLIVITLVVGMLGKLIGIL